MQKWSEYFIEAFKKCTDFSGRARRKQYWMFILVGAIIYLVLAIIGTILGTMWLSTIYSLILLLPSISITTRRLHDIGRSGWWQLIYLIPLVGLIVMVIFLCQDSHKENKYGVSPKSVA